MEKRILFCLFFYYFLTIKGLHCYHCTQSKIDSCWAPADAYLTNLGFDINSDEGYFYDMSDNELKQYCQIYDTQTSGCLADLVKHCDQNLRRQFEGLEDSQDFLCGDGLEGFLQHKECLKQDSVQNKIDACVAELNRDTGKVTYRHTRQEAIDIVCKAVYDAIDCEYDSVEDICDEDAAKWLKEYETRLSEPLLDQYGCSRGTSKTTIIIIVVCVVVAFLMVVIGTIVYCKNKKSQSNRQRQTGTVVFDNRMVHGMQNPTASVQVPQGREKYGLPPGINHIQNPEYAGMVSPPSYYPPSSGRSVQALQ